MGTPSWLSCSQNAHGRSVLAWDKSASRRARGWAGENVACSEDGLPAPTRMTTWRKSEVLSMANGGILARSSRRRYFERQGGGDLSQP